VRGELDGLAREEDDERAPVRGAGAGQACGDRNALELRPVHEVGNVERHRTAGRQTAVLPWCIPPRRGEASEIDK
jgi:hypothetical protein